MMYDPGKIIIRRVQDKVARTIIGCQLGRKSAPKAPSVDDEMIFRAVLLQSVVHELHVLQHGGFTASTGTLPESPVIDQHHIIVVPVEIPGVTRPTLDRTTVAMKIEDQPGGIRSVKMQPVDAHTGFHIKEQFAEWNIVFESEILRQLLRLEDETLLHKVHYDHHQGVSDEEPPPAQIRPHDE